MNFYVRQTEARRTTRWLVVLFVLAVLSIIVAVNFVALTVLANMDTEVLRLPDAAWIAGHPGTVVLSTLLVLCVTGGSSLYKSAQLAGGGGEVARSLGGQRLERTVQDPLRKRLFNVVEEMAIAAGVPLPEIYVLEHEEGINAFAAGYQPANAAIAVTRGALEQLNRSELQGVIAHEFGHVLNGDMRISTRLIGLLFGLLVVALIGRTILRWGPRRSRKGGGALMIAALAVMVLGYLGVFFGRLIQAAVSRRREALADASAVQFTREPAGLKGALVKIGAAGSAIEATEVDEVAHMLFAPGIERFFATHPPLIERIRALDPSFNESEFARVKIDPQLSPVEIGSPPAAKKSAPRLGKVLPAAVAQLVGQFGAEHVAAAHTLVGALPTDLLAQTGGPAGVLLALALDPAQDIRGRQMQHIGETLGAQTVAAVSQAWERISQLERPHLLPMLHEAVPELRHLPPAERQRLLECLHRLILIDGRIEIFEYALATLARVYLQDDQQSARQSRPVSFKQTVVELQTVFSTLALLGNANEADARGAFEAGMYHVLPQIRPPYNPVRGWPAALDRAVKCLDRLSPEGKSQLIEGLVKTIGHDGALTTDEMELLRAICAALHCPLPALSVP